ncbi:MAG: hypothetical protein JJ975_06060, partial [Bacteroidia bacterium]|nr:hypothetical protein [Bacteroidia bacterium]
NFMVNLLEGGGLESVEVHTPVLELFNALNKTFNRYEGDAVNGFTHQTSREMLDELGLAGEQYRFACYNVLESSKSSLAIHQLISFFRQAINHLDRAIKRNKREDGMYHSYNLLELTEGSARVSRLYEMLEGQVAVLSAGSLAPYEALQVLDALKGSAMYRADQYSYMLYPDRQLPSFLKKNTWPEEKKNSSKLVSSLLKNGDRSLIEQDNNGGIHFNGSIHNADDVLRLLESLKESEHYRDLVEEETELFLDVFEEMFDHQSFTGRSGTFYGYEGLGSIYWHMVSKLLMATQENLVWAKESSASDEVIGRLIEHYYEIRAGIGINKSPELYGAFPTDPYSHTPGNAGAQQPGMTGQVKEDVINRWAELGVVINEGCVTFDPFFMRRIEFLKQPAQFTYTAVSGDRKTINLEADSLAFTYCQVPVVYVASKEERLVVQHASGESTSSKDQTLSREDSECLLKRNGQIECITVYLVPGLK